MLSLLRRISRLRHYIKIPGSGLRVISPTRTMEESFIRSQEARRLLIIGMARTGTSLLQRLLNGYPTVLITYESIYSPFLGNNDWPDLHAYYYEILKQYRHLCLAMHPTLPGDSLKSFSFEEGFEYFGDKAIYTSSRRFRIYLEAAVRSSEVDKIIFILRDPRARLLSYFNWKKQRNLSYPHTAPDGAHQEHPDFRQKLLVTESQKWNQYIADVLHYTHSSPKCMTVKYEDLIASSDIYIKNILSFLDLDPALYPGQYLETIRPDSLNRWEQELDQRTIVQITDITRPYLYELHYDEPD